MKIIVSALILGLVTFAGAREFHKPAKLHAAIPIPLCNPTDPECTPGGN